MPDITTKELREYNELKKKIFPDKYTTVELDLNNPIHKRYNELSIKVAPLLQSLYSKV